MMGKCATLVLAVDNLFEYSESGQMTARTTPASTSL